MSTDALPCVPWADPSIRGQRFCWLPLMRTALAFTPSGDDQAWASPTWIARLRSPALGAWWRRSAVVQTNALAIVLCASGLALPPVSASAEPVPTVTAPAAVGRSPWAPLVAQAAARFALPEAWLMAIIAVESGGNHVAVSPAGAMGLMQLMPGTWRTLSRTYALGDDPFAPGANILAGAAYLRALHDRYGSPGFLAAYNAGPGRYEAYLRRRRPLPAETLRYVGRLAAQLNLPVDPGMLVAPVRQTPTASPDWRTAPLFSTPGQRGEAAGPPAPVTVEAPNAPQSDGLFAQTSGSHRP